MKENATPNSAQTWASEQLTRLGFALQRTTPLRVEASQRQFFRLTGDGNSWILMDSPPQLERNDQFAALAAVFFHHQIPVPAIIARDQQRGWFLLSDLGQTHLEDVYHTDQEPAALTAAINMLAQLGHIEDPLIEPYTRDRFEMELGIFDEWFVQQMLQQNLQSDLWQPSCTLLLQAIAEQPKGCVHRDFHCRNVLYSDNKLGIVDFQDALHGPILYDIASLLRDCYHRFEERQIDHWLGIYVAQMPELQEFSPEHIKRWFDFTAIQRQLKAVGIFARLQLRDGKPSHLPFIAPVMARLCTLTAQYRELAPLNKQLLVCTKSLADD